MRNARTTPPHLHYLDEQFITDQRFSGLLVYLGFKLTDSWAIGRASGL